MSRPFLTVLVVVLLCGSVLVARQSRPAAMPAEAQTPTFKVQVEYVEVDVQVTDQKGNFIGDLKQEEFEVFEDGKQQTLSGFALVDLPIERSDRSVEPTLTVESDVKDNERRFDGRVYVVILDDLHTDFRRTLAVKKAARRFVEQNVAATDLMAIVFTGGQTDAAREFTSNKRRLLSAVDRFTGQQCSPFDADPACPFKSADAREQDSADPRRYDVRRTMSLLKAVADWLGGVHGRKKTLILFSEGTDYDPRDTAAIRDIEDTIASAARSNVSIYALDPRGLSMITDDTITSEIAASIPSLQEIQAAAAGVPLPDRSQATVVKGLTNETLRAQTTLRSLADGTGGFAAINASDFGRAFDRIVAENSRYYVLAYYPPLHPSDGRFHQTEVRVRRVGVTVRARRGYASPKANQRGRATKGQSARASGEPLTHVLPLSDIRMRMFAAPFRPSQAGASQAAVFLGIEMMGRDLPLESNGTVEISYVAVDPAGKSHGSRTDRLALNLEPARRSRVEQSAVRVLNRMDLRPGQYQLRVVVHDRARSLGGSLAYDLEVPDFNRLPLAMSGLVLMSKSGSAVLTARVDEQIKGMLPAPPSAARTFAQNDELALFTEVYDDGRAPAQTLDVVTSVRSVDGAVVFERAEALETSRRQSGSGTYRHTMRIPLDTLQPGAYVLSVEVRSRLNSDHRTARRVPFSVTPPDTAR